MKLLHECLLLPEAIDAIFKATQSQAEYLVALHKAVVPNWERVESVGRSVACDRDTWIHIADQAVAWDQAHCPNCMPGGAWLNMGFSGRDDLPKHTVTVDLAKVRYTPNRGTQREIASVTPVPAP